MDINKNDRLNKIINILNTPNNNPSNISLSDETRLHNYNSNKSINIPDIDHSELFNILFLYVEDYSIFLTGRIFKQNCFNLKKNLLCYFDKYNICYFQYFDKTKIINTIRFINLFIKNAKDSEKEELIKLIYKKNDSGPINISKKLKQIFFAENIIEPNVLYKKIQFSNQELFIPFNNYVVKKMEYKLRTFCQIAEKLGSEKIVIDYEFSENKESNINGNIEAFSLNIGGEKNNIQKDNNKLQIIFEYPNLESSINLNKFEIIDSIFHENEFLITKEEFDSDIELKFLIDARCIHFIKKYHTHFIINHMNKVEQKILLRAQNYGLNIGNLDLKDNHIKFSIHINFFSIENNYELIDGTNIYILREGFYYLANIIKKNDTNYQKLLNFLKSHLNAIDKKWIQFDNKNNDKINRIYNDIITLNFREDEMVEIIEVFLKNNISWDNFIKFRNIILYGSDNEYDKLHFISFQYHDILKNKKVMLDDIYKFIKKITEDFLLNPNIFNENEILETYFNSDDDLINYKNNNRSLSITKSAKIVNDDYDINKSIDENDITIKVVHFSFDNELLHNFIYSQINNITEIIFLCFKKSFTVLNGLTDNIDNSFQLSSIIKNILNFYCEHDIKNLQYKLNEIAPNRIYDLKKNIFENLIDKICYDIIYKKILYLSDLSPIMNYTNDEKPQTLYSRNRKILIRFLVKYFENEKDNEVQYKYNDDLQFLNVYDIHTVEKIIEDKIPLTKVYKNYHQYKVFYTWNDFIDIKNIFYNKNQEN
jgi:hypothetical protein